jgi:hypothetical protein
VGKFSQIGREYGIEIGDHSPGCASRLLSEFAALD